MLKGQFELCQGLELKGKVKSEFEYIDHADLSQKIVDESKILKMPSSVVILHTVH